MWQHLPNQDIIVAERMSALNWKWNENSDSKTQEVVYFLAVFEQLHDHSS